MKCDGTRADTRFRISAKRTSPFKSAEVSVQSTTGNRSVRMSGSNAGYTMFRGSVKGTGYRLHSPVSPSLPLPCVTVCHQILTEVYLRLRLHIEFQVLTENGPVPTTFVLPLPPSALAISTECEYKTKKIHFP